MRHQARARLVLVSPVGWTPKPAGARPRAGSSALWDAGFANFGTLRLLAAARARGEARDRRRLNLHDAIERTLVARYFWSSLGCAPRVRKVSSTTCSSRTTERSPTGCTPYAKRAVADEPAEKLANLPSTTLLYGDRDFDYLPTPEAEALLLLPARSRCIRATIVTCTSTTGGVPPPLRAPHRSASDGGRMGQNASTIRRRDAAVVLEFFATPARATTPSLNGRALNGSPQVHAVYSLSKLDRYRIAAQLRGGAARPAAPCWDSRGGAVADSARGCSSFRGAALPSSSSSGRGHDPVDHQPRETSERFSYRRMWSHVRRRGRPRRHELRQVVALRPGGLARPCRRLTQEAEGCAGGGAAVH